MKTKTRVAVVQAAPVFMDLDGCMERARGLIRDATSRGAELVAFSEAWFPGYPAWLDSCRDAALWDHEATKNVFARLVENSVVVPSPHTEALASLWPVVEFYGPEIYRRNWSLWRVCDRSQTPSYLGAAAQS